MHRQKHNCPACPVKKTGTAVRLLVLLALMLCLLAGCTGKEQKTITSLDQLSEPGLRIGVPGTIIEYDMLKRDYPDAEIIACGDSPLGYQDVAAGRLDVYIYERREMTLAIEHGTKGVHLLEGAYHVNDVAVGISPKAAIPDLGKSSTHSLWSFVRTARWTICMTAGWCAASMNSPIFPGRKTRSTICGSRRPALSCRIPTMSDRS
ncbi:MAG: hypothetical protein IKQ45_07925 [Clostridia bacterium]|nr:hypothetical protein [Clostridia bacterium]